MGNFGYVYDLVFECIAVYRPKTQKKNFSFKTRSRDPTKFIYFYRLKRKFLHRLPNQTDSHKLINIHEPSLAPRTRQ